MDRMPYGLTNAVLYICCSVKQIKSAFYTLPKVFGESKIVEYTVQENPAAGGGETVHYKVLGKAVDLTSLIRLEVDGDKKPLRNRDTVSFPLAGASRRGAMLLTHALMGFGKDPSSPSSN